jgi:TusE/DsrC/DsvC family sulfur relay protein
MGLLEYAFKWQRTSVRSSNVDVWEEGLVMEMTTDQKLDLILEKVNALEKERQFRTEMWDEFSPILKLVMNSGSEKLQKWEDKGYFEFVQGLGFVVEQVMDNYTAEDVENLAKSVVGILDAIRTLTQDDVISIAHEAAEAIHNADKTKPLGVRGVLKASRDEDVRRGIGMMMELLRHVGKGAKEVKYAGRRPRPRSVEKVDPKQQKLAAMLAPKRQKPKGEVCVNVPDAKNPEKQVSACVVINGVELDKDGFLVDKNQWTEDLAKEIAKSMGYEDLTDAHWQLIKYSRQENMEKNSTPNMRKICVGCNVSAKHVFTLFPNAPAKTIAKIAGVSKPVGCI